MNNTDELQASKLYLGLSWFITLIVPVALVLTSVRLLLFPWFLHVEYSMPGFPADPFGFTKEDRLYWSNIAVDYLVNDQEISFLADLRFADGSRVYNERELKHMLDVKVVVSKAMRIWTVVFSTLVVFGLWAHFGGWWNLYRHGLRRGGWLTIILVAAIVLFVLIAFGILFVAFHNIFFEAGTWMFLWSDTLIRLFPERFWRDIFIVAGMISAGLGLAVVYLSNGFRLGYGGK